MTDIWFFWLAARQAAGYTPVIKRCSDSVAPRIRRSWNESVGYLQAPSMRPRIAHLTPGGGQALPAFGLRRSADLDPRFAFDHFADHRNMRKALLQEDRQHFGHRVRRARKRMACGLGWCGLAKCR